MRRLALALAAVATVTLVPGACSSSSGGVATAASGANRIDVEVRLGRILSGPRVVRVDRGQQVQLTVDADVNDKVHVHGYDLYSPVAAGVPATVTFAAEIPGEFDVELERSRLGLVEIQVD